MDDTITACKAAGVDPIKMRQFVSQVGYALLPPTCVLCGEAGTSGLDLCADCRGDLPYIRTGCYRCGAPLSVNESEYRHVVTCGKCLIKPPHYERLFSPLVYRSPVDWLIHRLKFNARLSHVRVLSHLLSAGLEDRCTDWPDLVVPVPLHPARFGERGFNQALEIARPLTRRYNLSLDETVCARRQDTPHQISLPARRRRANVRNAFVLNKPVRKRHVAVIDDVVTTGSTVNELARLLKRHGARRVDVWSVARAA